MYHILSPFVALPSFVFRRPNKAKFFLVCVKINFQTPTKPSDVKHANMRATPYVRSGVAVYGTLLLSLFTSCVATGESLACSAVVEAYRRGPIACCHRDSGAEPAQCPDSCLGAPTTCAALRTAYLSGCCGAADTSFVTCEAAHGCHAAANYNNTILLLHVEDAYYDQMGVFGYYEEFRDLYMLRVLDGVPSLWHNHANFISKLYKLNITTYPTTYYNYDGSMEYDGHLPATGVALDASGVTGHTRLAVNFVADFDAPQFADKRAMLEYLAAHPDAYERNLFSAGTPQYAVRPWSASYVAGWGATETLDKAARIAHLETAVGTSRVVVHVAGDEASGLDLTTWPNTVQLTYTGAAADVGGIPAAALRTAAYTATSIDVLNATSFAFDAAATATATGVFAATGTVLAPADYIAPQHYHFDEKTFFVRLHNGTADVARFRRWTSPSEDEVPGMRMTVEGGWVFAFAELDEDLLPGQWPEEDSTWGDRTTGRYYKYTLDTRKNLRTVRDLADASAHFSVDLSAWTEGFKNEAHWM